MTTIQYSSLYEIKKHPLENHKSRKPNQKVPISRMPRIRSIFYNYEEDLNHIYLFIAGIEHIVGYWSRTDTWVMDTYNKRLGYLFIWSLPMLNSVHTKRKITIFRLYSLYPGRKRKKNSGMLSYFWYANKLNRPFPISIVFPFLNLIVLFKCVLKSVIL